MWEKKIRKKGKRTQTREDAQKEGKNAAAPHRWSDTQAERKRACVDYTCVCVCVCEEEEARLDRAALRPGCIRPGSLWATWRPCDGEDCYFQLGVFNLLICSR